MSYAETPGNIDDLNLPDAQLRLAEAMRKPGKPVVLRAHRGAAAHRAQRSSLGARRSSTRSNPGLEGGQAIADVLSGDVNPSGKLPITYPRHPNALRTYDHKAFEEQDTSFGLKAFQPQFEFGFGLSYTTFEYAGLKVDPRAGNGDRGVTVSVTVRNTGTRAGKEVVQLYVTDHVASVTPPVKRLRRFEKIALEPGASRAMQFKLTREDLGYIGADFKPVVEPGAFSALVSGLKADFTIK